MRPWAMYSVLHLALPHAASRAWCLSSFLWRFGARRLACPQAASCTISHAWHFTRPRTASRTGCLVRTGHKSCVGGFLRATSRRLAHGFSRVLGRRSARGVSHAPGINSLHGPSAGTLRGASSQSAQTTVSVQRAPGRLGAPTSAGASRAASSPPSPLILREILPKKRRDISPFKSSPTFCAKK